MSFAMARASATAAIHAAFAQVSVDWRHDGEVVEGVTAIPNIEAEGLRYGSDRSTGKSGYEIPVAALPFKPANGDMVIIAGESFRVIEVRPYPTADAWRFFVEEW
jgi:hypothetical protein